MHGSQSKDDHVLVISFATTAAAASAASPGGEDGGEAAVGSAVTKIAAITLERRHAGAGADAGAGAEERDPPAEERLQAATLYPATHHVLDPGLDKAAALAAIVGELEEAGWREPV